MHITVCFEQPNCYKYFINKYCHGGSQTQTKDALISVQLAVDILTDCTVNDTKDIFYPQPVPPPLFTEALTQSSRPFLPQVYHYYHPPEQSSSQFA